jgi:prolyl-tRNA editing enzyme YbaK/EbsC (Cys-tRNA(Pro) deacylase)
VLVDASAEGWERVHVSAGVRGVDLEVGVQDLLAVTGGRMVDASRDPVAGATEEEASQ